MKLKKQSSGEQAQANSRFLIRHNSSSVLNIFGCCSSSSANESDSLHLQKPQPHKISIKNVIKKSAIFGMNGNMSINESQYFQADRKQENFSPSSMYSHRKNSQFSQMGESLIKNQSERTIPNKREQKINFIYNKQKSDKSVHNYHTTNYIVEKYIVKPQEMNIFVKAEQEKEKTFKETYKYPEPKMEDFNQEEEDQDNSAKWNPQGDFAPPQRFSNKDESTSNNCHFSFGQHQKQMFMNKFAGFRDVCSNRPSKQSVKQEPSRQQTVIEQTENRPEAPTFLKFKRENLHTLVRDVYVMDEQFDDSSSGKSEVIDSYQNIMSRIQEKGKILHLEGNQ